MFRIMYTVDTVDFRTKKQFIIKIVFLRLIWTNYVHGVIAPPLMKEKLQVTVLVILNVDI